MIPKNGTEWRISDGLTPFPEAEAFMRARSRAIAEAEAPECIWLLQHPPLYTAGTSAKPGDLLAPDRFPIYQTGRGGQFTYHGPGQRVAYVMLHLGKRGGDIRRFVHMLEQWVIDALAAFDLHVERRAGRVGLWLPGSIERPQERKIAAIGIRVSRGVTSHGIAINVDPDLSHFEGIVPCGIAGHGVTSLKAEGVEASMADLDAALRHAYAPLFDPIAADN